MYSQDKEVTVVNCLKAITDYYSDNNINHLHSQVDIVGLVEYIVDFNFSEEDVEQGKQKFKHDVLEQIVKLCFSRHVGFEPMMGLLEKL